MLIVALALALAAQETQTWERTPPPPPMAAAPSPGVVMPHRAYCRYGKVHLVNGRFVCTHTDRRTVHP